MSVFMLFCSWFAAGDNNTVCQPTSQGAIWPAATLAIFFFFTVPVVTILLKIAQNIHLH